MPGLTSQSSFVLQVEGITKQVEEALEFTAELSQILGTGRGEAVRVSTHAFRIILQSDTVSNYSANNPDGGPLPFGSGARWAQFTLLPVPYVIPVQFSMQAEWTGESQQTSIINPVAKSMADVAKQGAKIRDILLQTPGDGTLGTIASINGTTITLNSGVTPVIDGRGAKLGPATEGASAVGQRRVCSARFHDHPGAFQLCRWRSDHHRGSGASRKRGG